MAIKDVSVVLAHGAWADGSSWAATTRDVALYSSFQEYLRTYKPPLADQAGTQSFEKGSSPASAAISW